MAFFEVRNISQDFDGIRAVDDLSFDLNEGEITALIGPNGAGKTTVFNVIMGLIKPNSGNVWLDETCLTGKPPNKIARMGIARTFQNIRLYPQMTVLENILVALKYATGEQLISALLRTQKMLREDTANTEDALQLLEAAGLVDKKDTVGSELSHGQRRLVEITRALASDPKLLLLDEPTAGLFPEMVTTMKQRILALRDQRKTILFIEHNMNVVMDISDRIIVLNYGRKIAEGKPAEVRSNQEVITAYLGRKRSGAA